MLRDPFSSFAAPLPSDAEQHRGGAQLDHHLPHAHEHPRPLPEPRQGEARREDVVRLRETPLVSRTKLPSLTYVVNLSRA